jgi:hypothetical protein
MKKRDLTPEQQIYVEWLDTLEWSFFATLTTKFELTPKSARRAVERYFKIISRLSKGCCKLFYVTEPFELKDGMHLHCLIHLPKQFHDPIFYQKLIDAWQMAVGTYNRVKNEHDLWEEQPQSRIDLRRYKVERGAPGYLSKYLMKNNCDYDILTNKGGYGF